MASLYYILYTILLYTKYYIIPYTILYNILYYILLTRKYIFTRILYTKLQIQKQERTRGRT